MKVLFITHYSDLFGANKSLLGILEYLKSHKHIVAVVTPSHKGYLHKELDNLGIEYHIRKFDSPLVDEGTTLQQKIFMASHKILEVGRIIKLVKNMNPDFIYSNSSAVDVGALAALFTGMKHVWHIREFGDLDYRVSPFYGKFVQKLLLKKAFRRVYVSKNLLNHFEPEASTGAAAIYNGVIKKRVAVKLKVPKKRSSIFCFGYVGLLVPGKNVVQIIEAFASFRKQMNTGLLHLFGSGDDNYVHELKQLVTRHQLDNYILFHGYVAETKKIFNRIDCLIMSSRFEAFGRVTAEAMFHKVPVIGNSFGGGTKELIQHGDTGLLYNCTTEDLLFQMNHIYSDSRHYGRIQIDALTYALQNFVIDEQVKKIINFIVS